MKPTTAQAWKNQNQKGIPVEVPSGNIALVRRPGLQIYVKKGVIPNSLMPIVQQAMATGKADGLSEKLNSPKQIDAIMSLLDAVVVDAVIEPKVAPVPKAGEERQDDLLYVDEVDFDDKLFIFTFATGGVDDLATFREQQRTSMESV